MFLFFFKQKTAYDVRFSDWSSDFVLFRFTRAGVQLGRAADLQGPALHDRAAVAVCHERAGYVGGPEIQVARARRGQLAGGDRAQSQRVRVRDLDCATPDIHPPDEALAAVERNSVL